MSKKRHKASALHDKSRYDRVVHTSHRESAPDGHPTWRVADADLGGRWSWLAGGPEQLQHVHAALRSFESMTWHEILVSGKKQHHSVEVHQLSKTAQDRLHELGHDLEDHLVSLRFGGTRRIYGIRKGDTLHLLWLDLDHSVYPSHKKHT